MALFTTFFMAMLIFKKILILTIALFFSFLLLEGVLRIAGYLYVLSHGCRHKQVSIQSKGYTILCIGESTTFGMGVAQDDSYPSILEKTLNAKKIMNFKVINGGVPARVSNFLLDRLENEIALYSPDLVIAMMGINDISDPEIYSLLEKKTFASKHFKASNFLRLLFFALKDKVFAFKNRNTNGINKSYPKLLEEAHTLYYGKGDFVEAEKRILWARQMDPFRVEGYVMLEAIYKKEGKTNEMAGFYRDLKNNYNKIRYVCAKNNISFIAMQYPLRKLHSLQELFIQPVDDIIFVDNEKIFKEALKTCSFDELFIDRFGGNFGHCSPEGNRLIAENLSRKILKQLIRERER